MFDRGAPEPAAARIPPQHLLPTTITIPAASPNSRSSSSSSSSTTFTKTMLEEKEPAAAAAAEIESVGERAKMEHDATFLIRQTDAVEMTNSVLRKQTKKLEADSSNHDGSQRCKRPLTTVSCSPSGDLLVSPLPATPRNNNNPTTTTRPACLADDLSTICFDDDGMTSTPGAANTATSKAAKVALLQQLQEENARLRDGLLRCNKAVLDIQKNADLKVVRLEWEVARLRQQLADESALNSKYTCLNQSLRRQLQHVADHIVQNKNTNPDSKQRYEELKQLHHRELVVEKHMNELIHSRNQAIRDNTALKRLLLGTCFECRQRLPVKRKEPSEHLHHDGPVGVVSNNDGSTSSLQQQQQKQSQPLTDIEKKLAIAAAAASQHEEEATTTPSSIRPTYQTSARNVLDNLPKQPVAPKPTSITHRREPSSPLVRPIKSCLKTTTTSSTPSSPVSKNTTNSSSNYSPRTSTALLIDTNSANTSNSMRKSLMAHRFSSENRRNQPAVDAAAASQPQNARVSPGTRFRRRASDAIMAEPKTRRASTGDIAPAQNSIRSGRHPSPLARTSSHTRIVVKSPLWRKPTKRSSTIPAKKAEERPEVAATGGKQPKRQQQQTKQLTVKGLIHTMDQHSNELSPTTKSIRHPPALERIEF